MSNKMIIFLVAAPFIILMALVLIRVDLYEIKRALKLTKKEEVKNMIERNQLKRDIVKGDKVKRVIMIYFEDLNAEAQAAIVKLLGDNGNYDVFPIATIEANAEN